MTDGYVLDASALLCLLNDEGCADRVEAALGDAVISTVNFSEVVATIVERGGTAELAAAMLDPLHLEIVDFDRSQAVSAGELRAATRSAGLSFGDRACLALARSRRQTVLTADRAWTNLAVDLPIELLRDGFVVGVGSSALNSEPSARIGLRSSTAALIVRCPTGSRPVTPAAPTLTVAVDIIA